MGALFSSRQPKYSASKSHRRISRRKRQTSAVPGAPRKGRPAPILIIVAVIAAVILCWVMGRGCGTSRQAREDDRLRDYASTVSQLIERSSAIGVQFENTRNQVAELESAEVDRKLTQMVSDCAEIVRETGEVKVPASAEELHPFLRVGTDMRATGVEKFRVAILDVLENSDAENAAAKISEAMTDLLLSDEVINRYAGGLDSRLKASKTGDLGFPSVTESTPFVPNKEDALLASASSYVLSVSRTVPSSDGEVIRGVAVTALATSPARKDRSGEGVDILPYSSTFTVSVEIENQGNQEETAVPVEVSFTGVELEKESKEIERIRPGETVTLVFEGFEPALGRDKTNIIKVMAGPVPDERNLENNSMELRFMMERE